MKQENKTSEHSKFRRTKKWISFRKQMLAENPCCAFCGSKRATRTVHHIYNCKTEEEYENLSEDRFIVLCSQCHNFLLGFGLKKSDNKAVLDMKRIAREIGFGDDWVISY